MLLQEAGHIKNTALIFRYIQCLHLTYSEVAWVLVLSGSQVQPQIILDPEYLPDYLSVSYTAKGWVETDNNNMSEMQRMKRRLKKIDLFSTFRGNAVSLSKKFIKARTFSFHNDNNLRFYSSYSSISILCSKCFYQTSKTVQFSYRVAVLKYLVNLLAKQL